MTTKELIKQLKDWDYTVKIDDDFIEVYDSEECKYYFSVDTREEFLVDTYNNDFTELPVEDREILFGLIYKYTTTPVEEREEKKKYYLKHKFGLLTEISARDIYYTRGNAFSNNISKIHYEGKTRDLYLYKDDYNDLSLMTDNSSKNCKFKEAEIEDIKERFGTDLSDYEIIEVEG
ncbi:hypothetical protein KQI68_06780 [Peptoniphilus sp. MSJ-1]|uniref:DUF1642 domain-containing protein n=1 Tax=Peptoniphilus ovalis TaxID=2841503 RepID=A0ABS6FHM9_9FIRM|nr:hypothetical protein [Peptoniphilus ovalis]MBU5669543.1 hypothetical protein [Peptoniphilus ovalis]